MAQEVASWTPRTGLSPLQRQTHSTSVLQCATSPHEAAKAARNLIKQWPHARPPDPDGYIATLAAVLSEYPLGLVQECCDPRTGLARTREFPPTAAAIVEWCDKRLQYHRNWAAYRPRQKLIEKPAPAQRHPLIGKWLAELKFRLWPRAAVKTARQSPNDDELRRIYSPQQQEGFAG